MRTEQVDRHQRILLDMTRSAPKLLKQVIRPMLRVDPRERERTAFVARAVRRTDPRWSHHVALICLTVTEFRNGDQEREFRRAHEFEDDDLLLAPVANLADSEQILKEWSSPVLMINSHGRTEGLKLGDDSVTKDTLTALLKDHNFQLVIFSACHSLELARTLAVEFRDTMFVAFDGTIGNSMAKRFGSALIRELFQGCVSWQLSATSVKRAMHKTFGVINQDMFRSFGSQVVFARPDDFVEGVEERGPSHSSWRGFNRARIIDAYKNHLVVRFMMPVLIIGGGTEELRREEPRPRAEIEMDLFRECDRIGKLPTSY